MKGFNDIKTMLYNFFLRHSRKAKKISSNVAPFQVFQGNLIFACGAKSIPKVGVYVNAALQKHIRLARKKTWHGKTLMSLPILTLGYIFNVNRVKLLNYYIFNP